MKSDSKSSKGEVAGKAIIVTGAGSGIGAAIAEEMAREGGRVIIADINKAAAEKVAGAIIKDTGGEAIAVYIDIVERSHWRKLIEQTVARFGRLDVLFNNAGITEVCPFLEVEEANYERIMRVNALSVLIGMQEAAKQMISQGGGGKIINTASGAGKRGYPLFTAYSASKFAVVGLTQIAASELGQHKINVNALAPAVVGGTNISKLIDDGFLKYGIYKEPGQGIKEHSKNIVLGRYAVPKDLVGTAVFLASSRSDYMTGQTLMIDGGLYFL